MKKEVNAKIHEFEKEMHSSKPIKILTIDQQNLSILKLKSLHRKITYICLYFISIYKHLDYGL